MPRWFEGPLAAFDTETTGVDVEHDRIVSAALVVQPRPGAEPRVMRWLVDPGVPVPPAATAVHGLTDDILRRDGIRPGRAVEEMARTLAATAAGALPMVVMNAPFDLTLLDRELRRHRGAGLPGYLERAALYVLDPRVLDKHADRHRAGRRTLSDLCDLYDVPLAGAHDAASDALAALRVTRAIGERYADRAMGAMSPPELHVRQALWHAAQARGSQSWFARPGTDPAPARPRNPAWPLRPQLPAAA
jgi:DNA polymerase III subunit epsilon